MSLMLLDRFLILTTANDYLIQVNKTIVYKSNDFYRLIHVHCTCNTLEIKRRKNIRFR